MINRTVKGMGRTLDTLNKTQSEAGYNLKPLDEEAITIKARSGDSLVSFIFGVLSMQIQIIRMFQNTW
jgi:hypothetical protein